jgi:hypothetical protein
LVPKPETAQEINSSSNSKIGDTYKLTSPIIDYSGSKIASLGKSLSSTIDDQAACFFLANFVLLRRHGSTRGYFEFILPLMDSEPKNSLLKLVFSAVALAALGNQPNSKALLPLAVERYSKALNAVNRSIQNPKTILKDSTLAAVFLLGLFEVCTFPPISLTES